MKSLLNLRILKIDLSIIDFRENPRLIHRTPSRAVRNWFLTELKMGIAGHTLFKCGYFVLRRCFNHNVKHFVNVNVIQVIAQMMSLFPRTKMTGACTKMADAQEFCP